MKILREYMLRYISLTKYREGVYASEYARNNLRNMVIATLLLSIYITFNIFGLFWDEVYKPPLEIYMWLGSIVLFPGIMLLLVNQGSSYLSSGSRKRIRNISLLVCLGFMLPSIYWEFYHTQDIYTYMIMLAVFASIGNFRVREAVFLILAADLTVLYCLFCQTEIISPGGWGDEYKVMVIFSLLVLGIAVRRHVDYLLAVRERSLLRRVCETDPLTKILNRRGLADYLRLRSYSGRGAAVIFDVDDFKRYNDTYGHEQGDLCLREVASCLMSMGQDCDCVVARYGGEEFVAVFFTADKRVISMALAGCYAKLADKKIPSGHEATHPYVTLSAGMAISDCSLRMLGDCQELISQADKKLYLAKNIGKNRCMG